MFKRSNLILIASILINILLAGFSGYVYSNNIRLNNQMNDIISENHAIRSELNVTKSELEYIRSQANYYSRFAERFNSTQGYIGSSTVNIVAVKSERFGFSSSYKGVTMTANIEARIGEGRILVNTMPRIGIDIQSSVETARNVVEEATGINLGGTDIILNIEAQNDNEIVDGYSAGGCIAVALLAAINGDELNSSVFMTGTIEHDGSIGRVGAVQEKALAAAEKGAKIFLVPSGQGTIVINVRKESHPFPGMTVVTYEPVSVALEDYIAEHGYNITVIEVENLEQAYHHFLSKQ